VFGAAVMGSKVIRVVAEMGNLDTLSSALSGVYQVGKWNPAAQKIDMIATAPYVGNGTNGASETLERFKSEVDRHVSGEPIATAKGQAKTNGIPYVGAYEFGSHHLQNADKFTSNDMAEQAITYMLQQYSAAFNAPMCFYTSHGTQKPDGSWGLLPTVGADIAKWPRARAVQAFTR
jgi:hypothetical protein